MNVRKCVRVGDLVAGYEWVTLWLCAGERGTLEPKIVREFEFQKILYEHFVCSVESLTFMKCLRTFASILTTQMT